MEQNSQQIWVICLCLEDAAPACNGFGINIQWIIFGINWQLILFNKSVSKMKK